METALFQVVTHDRPVNRLRVAIAHLEVAIAHINNEAQARTPTTRGGDRRGVDELRLLVQTLAHIRGGPRCQSARSGAHEHRDGLPDDYV